MNALSNVSMRAIPDAEPTQIRSYGMSWDSGFAVDLPNKLVATDTTLNPKQTDSRHVTVARADEELAHAYEQITRADEQLSNDPARIYSAGASSWHGRLDARTSI